MKIISKLLLASYLCMAFITQSLAGPVLKPSKNILKNKEWAFVPNLGQVNDEHGNALIDVKYYGQQGGVYLYCRPGKLSFVFTKAEGSESKMSEASGEANPGKTDLKKELISACRADMVLIGANPNAQIIATEKQEYYENYFIGQTSLQRITDVHTFKTLTYKNIYPHTDMVLHCRPQGVKYVFVVHPGANVSDIQLQWYGLSKEASKTINGGMHYSMLLDKAEIGIEETAPICFTRLGNVGSQFVKHGNRIGFKVAEYDKRETLTIDPELNWGTYYGGASADAAMRVSSDASGNVIIAGSTRSSAGVASTGAFQTKYGKLCDIILAKFSNSGGLIWSSYYGGSDLDSARGLKVDASGNIYITGVTASSGMATFGAYQFSFTNTKDAILAKFNPSGDIEWATYMGANNDDMGLAVSTDASGNVYMTGRTQSDGMASSGAYQTSHTSGIDNGFLSKFSSSGSLLWSTYFGGKSATIATAVDADASGNVFVAGYTQSAGLASSTAYQSSYYGQTDAFLAKFNGNGSLSWATYFGGGSTDYCNDIKADGSGNVYLTGSTNSNGLATSGSYQSARADFLPDAYIAKFSGAGSLLWATYFGGDNSDIAYGLGMDADENVYITGTTNSTSGIATTGAYQNAYTKKLDIFLVKFSKAGKIDWATYYGSIGDDYAYGVCADASKNVFITGATTSESDIAITGAYHEELGAHDLGQIDGFLTKFSYPLTNNAGIGYIRSPIGKGCAGHIATKINIKNFGTDILSSLTIGATVNGQPQNDYQWNGSLRPGDTISISADNGINLNVGAYDIKVYISMPNGVIDSMPGNDTVISRYIAHPVTDTGWVVTNTGTKFHFKVKDSSLASKYYFWILSDGYHYTGYSFDHEFASKSSYNVKLITSNTFACINIHDTSFNLNGADIGYDPISNAYILNIYPNPFNDKTIIRFDNPQAANVQLSITDMLGKVVYVSPARNYASGTNEIELNTNEADLVEGTYIIRIKIGDDTTIRKIVKLR